MTGENKVSIRDIGPFLIRIGLGVIFMFHGYSKMFQGGHANIAKMMADKGAPMPEVLGWLAAISEFVGGALILVGFLSRIWGLGHVVVMLVAIFVVHGIDTFAAKDGGIEFPLALLLMALAIVISGPGRISIDQAVFGKKSSKNKKSGD